VKIKPLWIGQMPTLKTLAQRKLDNALEASNGCF